VKKTLLISIIILFSAVSAFCGEFEDTLKKAEQGDADAQFNLGFMYDDGEGVPQDYKQAIHWYTKAADQGNVYAQFNLGFMYANGIGITQDYKQTVYWYTKAADQGSIRPQIHLASMYAKGEGIIQDYQKALYWYTKAADQGDSYAQRCLGMLYYHGNGVAQNFKQAVYWYEKAAEQGDFYSQGVLGSMYNEGKGVPQNNKLAYAWVSLAAAQGGRDNIATRLRDLYAKTISPQQLSEAQDLAAQIQYKIDHPTESQKQEPSMANTEKKINGSGTGFIITKDGYVLTCHHVIKGAAKIEITLEGKTYPATLVRDDPNNDLALLKITGSFPAIAFSSDRSAKMGQEVFTIGYPNPSLQGVSAKFTEGTINSLTGFQDDIRLYQISIPVQPGNSGGALLDENGNVLGVVVAMLNAKTTFQMSGALPQNVNYAVKSLYAQAMIDTLPEASGGLILPAKDKSNAIDNVKKSTVMVICYD